MNFQYSHDRFPTQLFNTESCYITRRSLVFIQNKTCRGKKKAKNRQVITCFYVWFGSWDRKKPDDVLYEWKMKEKKKSLVFFIYSLVVDVGDRTKLRNCQQISNVQTQTQTLTKTS